MLTEEISQVDRDALRRAVNVTLVIIEIKRLTAQIRTASPFTYNQIKTALDAQFEILAEQLEI